MDVRADDPVTLRPAVADDAPAIASIWHLGWRDAHLGNVPQALVDARTEASFLPRAVDRLSTKIGRASCRERV